MKQIIMIGKPLSHVRSPYLLRDLIQTDQRSIAVNTQELGPEGLPDFMVSLRRQNDVLGLIVTTPLKAAVCAHAERLTADAAFIGAANSIRCDDEGWLAANFDGYGFAHAIADFIDARTRPRILLVGCGAAGSAIATSLVSIADMDLVLFDLEHRRAADLALRLRAFAPASSVAAVAQPVSAEIVINASTAGMEKDDELPLPASVIDAAHVVGDIVIRDTALKREARSRGKMLVDGEAMVRGQAQFLYRFLTGKEQSEREVLEACQRAG